MQDGSPRAQPAPSQLLDFSAGTQEAPGPRPAGFPYGMLIPELCPSHAVPGTGHGQGLVVLWDVPTPSAPSWELYCLKPQRTWFSRAASKPT